MKASTNIRRRRSPETRMNTMLQSRKNASPNQMLPRRKILARTINLRKIIRHAARVAPDRISAVETIAAMTVATIAARIPAATVAVAVSAGAVDAAAEDAPGPVAAICRHRNMLRRKARTIRAVMTVATNRARKARIVVLNLADSNRVAQRSAASIIAVPNRRAKAALLQ